MLKYGHGKRSRGALRDYESTHERIQRQRPAVVYFSYGWLKWLNLVFE